MFRFGIEHEVAFLDREGQFVDFVSASFSMIQAIIDELPQHASDEEHLRIGDAGIRVKRWYIEGFERFSEGGELTDCLPKGIEIRTTIHPSIRGAVNELTASFHLLQEVAARHNLLPVLTSHHPYRTCFVPDPPLNAYEQQVVNQSPEDRTAVISMVTYGPDLNFSMETLSVEDMIDLGQKLTYYSPYIVPWSFSSPFYNGRLWEGLSVRTFLRTGPRPAVQVFLARPEDLLHSDPSLTKLARSPAEIGRIEFKACDSCSDFSLYAALLTLLKGLTLDETLGGRAIIPDRALHQSSARFGFAHADVFAGAKAVLRAATEALGSDPDIRFLEPLHYFLQHGITPAHRMVQAFRETNSIEAVLRETYQAPSAPIMKE
ncbi:MAG TPA: glutamate--cysteine ligase [Ktedonobacteraceae bacterium]|jgi:gamma-glutamyl:cysteine ligase YbdK (ATP-grasp superfamily)|nr:glutamate--cysteine ligase [Ktedonobacteraceae bacterium]